MSDFSEFAEPNFDLKAWINRACAQAGPEDESLDRFLAEQEMRLQLTAEEIEASLHDMSVQAMRRIPFAVQEIYRLQGDIQGMQDQMAGLAGGIKRDAASAMESVAELQQLDRVKSNMESACSTLKEATELSGLFVKVEEVFAAGDLPRVADILSSMRRSLSLVGDVPEFRAGRQKLHSLEDRLQGLIEGSLAEALAQRGSATAAAGPAPGPDEEPVRKLCTLLLAVDRLSTIDSLYCSARSAAVSAKWDELSSAPAAAAATPSTGASTPALLPWLPRFLSWLSSFLESESAWCARVLPQQQTHLVASLCRAVFKKVSRGVRDALGTGAAAAQVRGAGAIALLLGLQRDLEVVATTVANLLKASDPQTRKDVLSLVFLPVEDKVAAYSTLEQAQLAADLAAVSRAGVAQASSAEEVVAHMGSAAKAAFAVLHQAVERCASFTGGTELRSLMRAVDHELASLLASLQSLVTALHDRHTGKGAAAAAAAGSASGPAGPSAAARTAPLPGTLGYGDDSEEVAGTLRLLLVYVDLSSGLNRIEAEIRTTIAAVVPKLESASERGKSGPPDATALRLDAAPDKLHKVQKLLSSLQEPRFIALPGAAAALDALHACIQATLQDALLAKVKVQLHPVPSMPEWKKSGAPSSASAVSLPSFNSYPLPYVTATGEYLMTLPQQLEVLMSEDESAGVSGAEADVEELAAEWLDRVVTGAAALYAEQILLIPELGLQGGAQLAADVEYFCNVMSALHGSPPASLLTVQLFAGQAPEQFAEAARQAAAEGGADMAMLRALASMRRLPGV